MAKITRTRALSLLWAVSGTFATLTGWTEASTPEHTVRHQHPIHGSLRATKATTVQSRGPDTGPTSPLASRGRRLTEWPGVEDGGEFSPDGKRIAFEATVDGQTDVYVLYLDNGEIHQLTDSPFVDRQPTWSLDGDTLAFQSTRGGATGIWSIPADGGEPRPLFVREGVRAIGPDFSIQGELVATVIEPDPTSSYGYVTPWVMNADGGSARSVTSGGDEWWARWGPRGEWLYYYGGYTDPLEAVHAETGKVRSISRGRHIGYRPAVSIDERLAFVSSPNSSIWLRSLDAEAELVQLTDAIGGDSFPSFSPDGTQLVISSDRAIAEVIDLDLESGRRRRIGEGRSPQPLPDGSIALLAPNGDDATVVIVSGRDGRQRVLETPLRGITGFAVEPSLKRWVAVANGGGPRGQWNLHLVDFDGNVLRQLTQDPGSGADTPVWCDVGSLGYTSYADVLKFRQVFRLDIDSGQSMALTDSPASKRLTDCFAGGELISFRLVAGKRGVYTARQSENTWVEKHWVDQPEGSLSPDRTRLAYVHTSPQRSDIYIREADGSTTRVSDDALVESGLRWRTDGSGLVFSARTPGRDLWLLDVPPAVRSRH